MIFTGITHFFYTGQFSQVFHKGWNFFKRFARIKSEYHALILIKSKILIFNIIELAVYNNDSGYQNDGQYKLKYNQ